MSKHTPGPWVAQRGGDISFVRTVDGGIIDRIVASHANAILIAAAPDMLEALERIAEYMKQSEGDHGYYLPWHADKQVLSAIAKAKGEGA